MRCSWPPSRVFAGDSVIGFRNNGTGAYPDADPPMAWSCTTNVVWRWRQDPLTASTTSSLIMVGDRIFTLGHPMRIFCLDKNTGEELLRRDTHVHDDMGDTATAMHDAQVRDGRIFALHGMGIKTSKRGGLVVCYDLEGDLQWTHGIIDSKGKPGAGGTALVPSVGDGKVVVDRNGLVLCLAIKTGEVVWKLPSGSLSCNDRVGHTTIV